MLCGVSAFDRPKVPPTRTKWHLPSPNSADEHGLVAVGADLEPGTLLSAYSVGLFPMPTHRRGVAWWSPDPRGILPLDALRVSKSLRRSCRRYDVRFDTCFREVMQRCGDPSRPNGWINGQFIDAYHVLHTMGWAHSVEVFDDDGLLVGGLYGVRINRFFAGESMFAAATDASKVALVALVDQLRLSASLLLDVQWTTPHLVSLGAVDVSRAVYLERLSEAIRP
jgi:leucyl/phenylalanyl-tRNA--protein transferase